MLPLVIILAIAVAARLRRATTAQVLVGLLVAVVVASYLYSILLTAVNGTAAFFSPLTRAWELAIGCLIAVAGPWLAARTSAATAATAAVLCWFGIAAIAWSVAFLDDTSSFPGSIAAVPVLGAAAILIAGARSERTLPAAVLGSRIPRYIGDISYSLYLVHWPVFTITAERRRSVCRRAHIILTRAGRIRGLPARPERPIWIAGTNHWDGGPA